MAISSEIISFGKWKEVFFNFGKCWKMLLLKEIVSLSHSLFMLTNLQYWYTLELVFVVLGGIENTDWEVLHINVCLWSYTKLSKLFHLLNK